MYSLVKRPEVATPFPRWEISLSVEVYYRSDSKEIDQVISALEEWRDAPVSFSPGMFEP